MPRPSKLGQLQDLIEDYLDEKDAAWSQQGEARNGRTPTLPRTADGKVNVRELSRELQIFAMERGEDASLVPDSAWQYFYKHESLAKLVDLFAEEQGLAKIGSRIRDDAKDDAAAQRITRLGKYLKGQSEGHAQSRARVVQLEKELAEARGEIGRLHERLRIMQRTGIIVRNGDVAG